MHYTNSTSIAHLANMYLILFYIAISNIRKFVYMILRGDGVGFGGCGMWYNRFTVAGTDG